MSQSSYADPLDADEIRRSAHATRARLNSLARLLDSAVVIPGTSIRIGLDAALDWLPGLGQVIATGVSAYIIYEARRLGAPASLILRMIAHVGLDFLISAIPVIGWIGDIFYRSNIMNVKLLNEYLDRAHPPPVLRPDHWRQG